MPSIQWVEPVMTWDGGALSAIERPAVLEFTTDTFMPDFLAAMAITVPQAQASGALTPEQYLQQRRKNGTAAWRFYHPLHSRYYLVSGSLVCRQLGLPDKPVASSDGERTSFVIRRIMSSKSGGETEMAWVEGQGWQTVSDKQALHPGEEQLPLHTVSACTGAGSNGSPQPARRTLHYGYIPVGNRQKYLGGQSPTALLAPNTADPAAAIQKFQQAVKAQSAQEPDYRLFEYDQHVATAWADLINNLAAHVTIDATHQRTASLYILLDLGDFLTRALPTVWAAIDADNRTLLGGVAAYEALYDALDELLIDKDGNWVSVKDELNALEPKFGLVNGEDLTEPSATYDVTEPHRPAVNAGDPPVPIANPADYVGPSRFGGTLAGLVSSALAQETRPMAYADAEETLRILNAQVSVPDTSTTAAGGEFRYRIRLVYDYDPDCPPLLSAPSRIFTLAPLMDPDAPARMVKLELPSIKMQDLRKYARGVGMQMTPELRDLMNRVHKDVADDGLLAATGLELGMICTFSIQIIFLVAFIVMFIFLIALNFIFWWLPFLKICFPIPKSSS